MIDFDALFTKFILDWHKENSDKFTPDEIENMVADIYELWADAPAAELINVSPREYFSAKSTADLIALLKECCKSEMSPPSLLLDGIAGREDADKYLLKIVAEKEAGQLTMMAVNLLNEIQSDKLDNAVYPWIFDSSVDGELRELAAEMLSQYPENHVDDILKSVKAADKFGKTLAADILVNVPENDKIFALLIELFREGDNIPLYASYLGKYGNPAAIEEMTAYLPSANYMEFIELSNAIERLGGAVDFEKDWSDDYYYNALKGAD